MSQLLQGRIQGARAPLKLEKNIPVKSWFLTQNTPNIFAPPSARRNLFKYALLTWNLDPPLYCTVHVYVVIHFFDKMWSLLSGSESVQAFLSFVYICILPLEIQLSRREDWDPSHRFKPATCVCLYQARTWISNVISWCLLCSVCSI